MHICFVTILTTREASLWAGHGTQSRIIIIHVSMISGSLRFTTDYTYFGSIDDEDTEQYYKNNFDAEYSSDYDLHKKFPEITIRSPRYILNEGIDAAFGLEYGTPIDLGYNIHSEIKYPDGTVEIDDMWGGGLTVISPSFAISFNQQFSVGVQYNIPISFNIQGESEFSDIVGSQRYVQEWEFSGGSFFMVDAFAQFGQLTVGASYQSAFEPEGDSFKSMFYQNGQLINETDSEGWNLSFPSTFQFGLEYEASEKLTVVADYQLRNFEDIKINDQKAFSDLKNGYKIGVGAEYDWCENWDLRLGVSLDNIPIADFDDDTPATLLGVGGGVRTDLNEFLNLNIVDNIYFDGFFEANSWSIKSATDAEYKETRFTLGSSISFSF